MKGTDQVKYEEVNIGVINAYMPIDIFNTEILTKGVNINLNWTNGTAYLIAVKKIVPHLQQVKLKMVPIM